MNAMQSSIYRAIPERGYVLVMVVWVLAFASVAAGYFSNWSIQAVSSVGSYKDIVDSRVEEYSARNNIIYLFLTNYMTENGLQVNRVDIGSNQSRSERVTQKYIKLDDTIYETSGNILFSVQDVGGLIPLNMPDRPHYYNLLGLLGMNNSEISGLIAKTLDYIDKDDLVNVNGAESAEYKNAGMLPPANRSLVTPWELRNVLGYAQQERLWGDDGIARLTNTSWNAAPNFNTAPEIVLKTWYGVTDEYAQRILNARKTSAPKSSTDLFNILGDRLDINPLALHFYPSRYLRITIWKTGMSKATEYHMILTPSADGAKPWLIEYQVEFPFSVDRLNQKERFEFDIS